MAECLELHRVVERWCCNATRWCFTKTTRRPASVHTECRIRRDFVHFCARTNTTPNKNRTKKQIGKIRKSESRVCFAFSMSMNAAPFGYKDEKNTHRNRCSCQRFSQVTHCTLVDFVGSLNRPLSQSVSYVIHNLRKLDRIKFLGASASRICAKVKWNGEKLRGEIELRNAPLLTPPTTMTTMAEEC